MREVILTGLLLLIVGQAVSALTLDVQPAPDQPPVTIGIRASDGQTATVGIFICISAAGVTDISNAFNIVQPGPRPLIQVIDPPIPGCGEVYFVDLAVPDFPPPPLEGLVAGGIVVTPEDEDVVVSLMDGDTFEHFESVTIIHEPTCIDKFTMPGYERQLAEFLKYRDRGYNMDCWCKPYQCYGDIANDKHILGYRVYTTDLNAFVMSWKAKADDIHLNPCADLDHNGHIMGYRVYTGDLEIIMRNWKKHDSDLNYGDCPRPDSIILR